MDDGFDEDGHAQAERLCGNRVCLPASGLALRALLRFQYAGRGLRRYDSGKHKSRAVKQASEFVLRPFFAARQEQHLQVEPLASEPGFDDVISLTSLAVCAIANVPADLE